MQAANESSSNADSESGKRPSAFCQGKGGASGWPSPRGALTPANLNANLVQITEHRRAKTKVMYKL